MYTINIDVVQGCSYENVSTQKFVIYKSFILQTRFKELLIYYIQGHDYIAGVNNNDYYC